MGEICFLRDLLDTESLGSAWLSLNIFRCLKVLVLVRKASLLQLQRINNNNTANDKLIKDVHVCDLQTQIQLLIC